MLKLITLRVEISVTGSSFFSVPPASSPSVAALSLFPQDTAALVTRTVPATSANNRWMLYFIISFAKNRDEGHPDPCHSR